MPYLSDIHHRRVLDASGEPIGRLRDLAVMPREQIPAVRWAILGTRDGERVVRWADLAIEPAHVRLRRRLEGLAHEAVPPEAIRLGRDLLDQEIASGGGDVWSVTRTTDLKLEEAAGQLRLIGVDVSARGLWRRIGIDRLLGSFALERIIPWSEVRRPEEVLPAWVRSPGRSSRS